MPAWFQANLMLLISLDASFVVERYVDLRKKSRLFILRWRKMLAVIFRLENACSDFL